MYRPKGRIMLTKETGPREENPTNGGGSGASSPRPSKGKGKGKGSHHREGDKAVDRKDNMVVNKEDTPPGKGNRKGGGKGKKGNDNDKSRTGKGVNDGSRSKSSTPEKVKEQAVEDQGPPGSSRKVVIRLLPPTITEDQLWNAIPDSVKDSVVGRYFVGGSQPKRPSITCPAVNSRCYLEFDSKQKAYDFVSAFHGHKFVDHCGETYRAVVCASPWGRCLPSSSGRRPRHDIKEGSIDKCKYFRDFMSSIKEESQAAALPEPTEVTCDPGKTPLVDYINEWYREKERKREKERRRQREAAEEARRKKKQAEREAAKNDDKGNGDGKEGKKKKGGGHHHHGGGSKEDDWWYDQSWYGYRGGYRGSRRGGGW